MARLAFLYAGSGRVRWDIRWRVAGVAVFSVAALACPPVHLVPLYLGVLVLLAWARVGWAPLARVVASFSGFLLWFFALGVLFTPTWQQAAFLGVQSARLLALLLASHFLAVTATPHQVTSAIQSFLGFVGRRRAWLAASMAGWALAAVPRILDQARGLSEAATLRAMAPRRHPLGWMRLLTLGLLVRVVEQAAETAWALEARAFGNEVPRPDLQHRPLDAVYGLLWMAWCVLWMMV